MKAAVKICYILISFLYIVYLVIPGPNFPKQLPGSLQSDEPADTESDIRRAYFTDFNRTQVLDYYQDEFSKSTLFGIPLLTYRLNYPPEDAQILIRDQTRSSYLQEIVHPFRESLFINGFIPQSQKDTIIIKGSHWEEKITVKYVESNIIIRFLVGISTVITGWVLILMWSSLLEKLSKSIKNLKWIFR